MNKDVMAFDGRTAIVTGAGRGIGRAHAIELARRGAKIVVNDPGYDRDGGQPSREPADEVVATIAAQGGEAVADYGDVSDPRAAAELTQQATKRWGRLDIVINNGGNLRHKPLAETTIDDLLSQIQSHVLGSLLVTQHAWPHMMSAGYGRIVLTTSQVGMYGQPGLVAYGAVKGGMIGLLHGLKIAALDSPIRVNCVSPFALTRMAPSTFPEAMADWMSADQVSAAVAFLAHESCQLHGEVLIAGAGHFAVARTIESRGVDFPSPASVTAEAIAARYADISNYEGYATPTSALDAVTPVFDRLRALVQRFT